MILESVGIDFHIPNGKASRFIEQYALGMTGLVTSQAALTHSERTDYDWPPNCRWIRGKGRPVTETAPRERAEKADRFKGFDVVQFEGRVYGIPTRVARVDPTNPEQLRFHPAIVSAPTEDLLEARLANFDPTPFESQTIGEFEDYSLVRHSGRIFGVPQRYGSLDLNWEEDRGRDGVVSAANRSIKFEERIRRHREAAPVEFLGWLPTFKWFGNCGAHPQFGHTELPPHGYKFVRSRPVAKPASKKKQARPSLIFRLWRLATLPYRCAREWF